MVSHEGCGGLPRFGSTGASALSVERTWHTTLVAQASLVRRKNRDDFARSLLALNAGGIGTGEGKASRGPPHLQSGRCQQRPSPGDRLVVWLGWRGWSFPYLPGGSLPRRSFSEARFEMAVRSGANGTPRGRRFRSSAASGWCSGVRGRGYCTCYPAGVSTSVTGRRKDFGISGP